MKKLNKKSSIELSSLSEHTVFSSPKIFKTEKTFDKVGRMLSMAGAANVGGVLAGSIGANKDSKKRKWKEAAFQFMNTSIPMIMVSSILTVCEKVKSLNNNLAKIIGSIVGMVGGAMIATGITNLTRPKGEPARKYTIKELWDNLLVDADKVIFLYRDDYYNEDD